MPRVYKETKYKRAIYSTLVAKQQAMSSWSEGSSDFEVLTEALDAPGACCQTDLPDIESLSYPRQSDLELLALLKEERQILAAILEGVNLLLYELSNLRAAVAAHPQKMVTFSEELAEELLKQLRRPTRHV